MSSVGIINIQTQTGLQSGSHSHLGTDVFGICVALQPCVKHIGNFQVLLPMRLVNKGCLCEVVSVAVARDIKKKHSGLFPIIAVVELIGACTLFNNICPR